MKTWPGRAIPSTDEPEVERTVGFLCFSDNSDTSGKVACRRAAPRAEFCHERTAEAGEAATLAVCHADCYCWRRFASVRSLLLQRDWIKRKERAREREKVVPEYVMGNQRDYGASYLTKLALVILFRAQPRMRRPNRNFPRNTRKLILHAQLTPRSSFLADLQHHFKSEDPPNLS